MYFSLLFMNYCKKFKHLYVIIRIESLVCLNFTKCLWRVCFEKVMGQALLRGLTLRPNKPK